VPEISRNNNGRGKKETEKPAILARHVGGISHGKRSTLEEQKAKIATV
jgi:hypothetical protein